MLRRPWNLTSAVANSVSSTDWSPTKINFKFGLSSKQPNDAGIVTRGPKSPPIASIEIVKLTLTNNPKIY